MRGLVASNPRYSRPNPIWVSRLALALQAGKRLALCNLLAKRHTAQDKDTMSQLLCTDEGLYAVCNTHVHDVVWLNLAWCPYSCTELMRAVHGSQHAATRATATRVPSWRPWPHSVHHHPSVMQVVRGSGPCPSPPHPHLCRHPATHVLPAPTLHVGAHRPGLHPHP